jgi:hypothetical protein
MSVDEVRSGGEGARRSLDEAAECARRATTEAEELEQSAAGHGWTGVAQAMSSAQEALTEAAAPLGDALEAVAAGLAALAQLTDESSSDEVALLLGGIDERFDGALTLVGRAAEALGAARQAATEAGAEGLVRLVDDVETSLAAGREALETAARATTSEHSEATAWGTGHPGNSTPGSQPPPPDPGDPGITRRPLGDRFRPGVHDPEGRFTEKERRIADWLATQDPGLSVHPRPRDPMRREKSPDATTRADHDDVGTVTEFKTLNGPTSRAVKDNLRTGTHQVLAHGNGHVVIDGRTVGVTEADARQGYGRFAGERRQHGRPMPRQVTIILGDGTALTWRNDV